MVIRLHDPLVGLDVMAEGEKLPILEFEIREKLATIGVVMTDSDK
jgi:hypothetical protein